MGGRFRILKKSSNLVNLLSKCNKDGFIPCDIILNYFSILHSNFPPSNYHDGYPGILLRNRFFKRYIGNNVRYIGSNYHNHHAEWILYDYYNDETKRNERAE